SSVELVVFPNAFQIAELILKADRPIVVTGTLEKEVESCKVLVDKVELAEDLLKKAKHLVVKLNGQDDEKLALLKEVLIRFPGSTKVQFEVTIDQIGKTVRLDANEPEGVQANNELFESIYTAFGST